jgi:Co/Zn/Cd efflux system component
MTAGRTILSDEAATASTGESTKTVAVAFGSNLVVAVAKTVAGFLSGSVSMAAEAAHSWADTGNQGLLMVANRRSSRPADHQHPLGYGREAYVWSLLAAVGLFVVGGTVRGSFSWLPASTWRAITVSRGLRIPCAIWRGAWSRTRTSSMSC